MPGTGDTSVRSYNFFLDTTLAGGGTYGENEHDLVDAGSSPQLIFTSKTLQWGNDAANDIFFSFDGVNDHGRLIAGEKLTQDFRRVKKIWFRGTGGDAFRFWAW